jgi:hypothetical protein
MPITSLHNTWDTSSSPPSSVLHLIIELGHFN